MPDGLGSARRWAGWAIAGAAVAFAALAVALLTSPSQHVGPSAPYGIATTGANRGVSRTVAICDVPQVPCPAGGLTLAPPFSGGSRGATAFDAFRKQVLDPPGHLRLWIPYDALYAWSPSANGGRGGCSWSPYSYGPRAPFNDANGTKLFARLVWDIQGAQQLGLSPEVVISAGSGLGAPSYPAPGYGDGRSLFAGLTPAGYDYYCGVLGIVGWLRAELGDHAPIQFEAFNEPDAQPAYRGDLANGCAAYSSCGGPSPGALYNHRGYLCGRRYAGCGPLEAAELWELAQLAARAAGSTAGQVAALSMTQPQHAYGRDYIEQLKGLSTCAPGFLAPGRPCLQFPRYWAVHDYDDPTAGGTADLQAFEKTLSRNVEPADRNRAALSVWVTESGVELSSQTRADLNRRGCHSAESRASGTLGACVDGNPRAQSQGARAWRRLLEVHAPGVGTTQLYWFEFQLIGGWDSALVDSRGKPRPAFCALVSGLKCDGNPTAYLMPAGQR
jgi:hypothetical protein